MCRVCEGPAIVEDHFTRLETKSPEPTPLKAVEILAIGLGTSWNNWGPTMGHLPVSAGEYRDRTW